MSDYGDLCRDLRAAKAEARAKHGVPCPECVAKLPKACPSILLPQQRAAFTATATRVRALLRPST